MEGQIDGKQIKMIHLATGRLGMNDATYRYLLRNKFGVDSSKKLTYAQASELLNYLVSLGFRIKPARSRPGCVHCMPRPKREKLPDNTILLVSPQQLVKIEHLKQDIRWQRRDGFERWLLKYFKIERIRLSIEATQVIEALKNMLRNQNRCACKWNFDAEAAGHLPRLPLSSSSPEDAQRSAATPALPGPSTSRHASKSTPAGKGANNA